MPAAGALTASLMSGTSDETATNETSTAQAAGDATPAAEPAQAAGDATPAASPEPQASQNPPVSSPEPAEEIEPEEVAPPPAPRAKLASHHPPPPPSLRAGAASHADRPLEVPGDPKLAKELMTRKLFTIGPEDPIGGLEAHMTSFHFRHLPVVEGDKLLGVISLSDLLHASSSYLSERAKERDAIIHKTPASRIMRRDVITVAPDQPLAEVARIMWRTRARCVPVVDDDDKLVGIITEGDFVRLAHHFLMRAGAK
jgi:CBS domain-containing protein